jgi:hypothetical protein
MSIFKNKKGVLGGVMGNVVGLIVGVGIATLVMIMVGVLGVYDSLVLSTQMASLPAY